MPKTIFIYYVKLFYFFMFVIVDYFHLTIWVINFVLISKQNYEYIIYTFFDYM